MTPQPQPGGLRAIAAPESIGAGLAIVLLVVLALAGGLPGIGGGRPGASPTSPASSAIVAPSTAGLSTTTRNALMSALAVNQRLATHIEPLGVEVDGNEATGASIAAILRTMNQDVSAGIRAAEPIALDPRTAALGGDLRTFYGEVARRDDGILSVSIQEAAAYRAAAADLIDLLGALPDLDDRITAALDDAAASGRPTASATPSAAPSAPPSPSPSPTPTPTGSSGGSTSPSASPAGPSLLDNGTFDEDLAGWTLEIAPGADASAAVDATGGPDGSGAARIDITIGSAARSGIVLVSSPFGLERGRRYAVTAKVRADAVREVRLRIATVEGQTTTARAFTVGPTWSTATFELTELASGSTSVFAVDVGRSDASVWLDDITITRVGG